MGQWDKVIVPRESEGCHSPFLSLLEQVHPGRGTHGSRGPNGSSSECPPSCTRTPQRGSRCRGPCPQLEDCCVRFGSGLTFSRKHSLISLILLCVPSSFPKKSLPVALCFTPLTYVYSCIRPTDALVSTCYVPGAVLGSGDNMVSKDIGMSLSPWSTHSSGGDVI